MNALVVCQQGMKLQPFHSQTIVPLITKPENMTVAFATITLIIQNNSQINQHYKIK